MATQTKTKSQPSSITDRGGIKVMEGDRRYPSLCRGFNPRWSSRPEYVRLVRSSDEARYALEQAVRERPKVAKRDRITVRAGGHCYENFVCSDDVRVIIDVSLLDGIYTEKQKGPKGEDVVCVEAGATNGDLRKRLFLATGKTLPGGSCSTVGMGGHIPAGGFGLLSRQFGLTVDYLYGVEVAVVGADKKVKLVKATADSKDPKLKELWWAHTGGGGGNFGLVTKFYLHNLPTAPKHVLLSAGGWPWKDVRKDDFTRIVNNFGGFWDKHRGMRDEFSALFGILLLTHRSKEQIGLIAQMDASVPHAKDRMNAFLKAMDRGHKPRFMSLDNAYGEYPALSSLTTPAKLTWNTTDKTLDPVDNLSCGKHKSAYLRKPMGKEQIEAMWKALAGEGTSVKRNAVVQVDSYGSAINRPRSSATAAYQRDSIMKIQHQIYWPAPGKGVDELKWIRTLYRNMFKSTGGVPIPNGTGEDRMTDGCYIGYPDVDLSDPKWNSSSYSWHDLYYGPGNHYTRLQQVKENFDPLGIFRFAQSVMPYTKTGVKLPRPRQAEGAAAGTRAAARPARAGGGRATATARAAGTRAGGTRGAAKAAGTTRSRPAAARSAAAKTGGTTRTRAATRGAAPKTAGTTRTQAARGTAKTTPARGAAKAKTTRAPAAAKSGQTRTTARTTTRASAAAKSGQTRTTTRATRTPAAAKSGQPRTTARMARASAPAKGGQSRTTSRATKAPAASKNGPSRTTARATPASAAGKGGQARTTARSTRAPAAAKSGPARTTSRAARAPAAAKSGPTRATARMARASAPAKGGQSRTTTRAPAAAKSGRTRATASAGRTRAAAQGGRAQATARTGAGRAAAPAARGRAAAAKKG
ncbi:BBE domain-containing protein [Nocardiopsis mangrovi]|uniref:BBE domain-containing protein n=1 Tax=Nocardiopsis mangrovi TaxID=1179818 RepID=A0ABV9E459_9ACTN